MASRSQTEQHQQTSVEIGEVLKELELKIERLKTLYEQYFMGIEKMEPQVARKEVTRTMLTLQQQYIRNTAMRFKFNTMLQKWQIYITYWNRTLREIENGTYIRHLAKAKRKAEREQSIAISAKDARTTKPLLVAMERILWQDDKLRDDPQLTGGGAADEPTTSSEGSLSE
ncbi:MAG: hypothetical protein LC659_11045 [Myxococcales bacterium]|nr:hypothetical protein [Myxococcales bacterium]